MAVMMTLKSLEAFSETTPLKRKVAEALLTKELKPTLNVQKLVQLKLFN